MSTLHRTAVLAAFGLYFLFVLVQNQRSLDVSLRLFAALTLYMLLRVIPILCYQRSFGWFHPLVFGSLFSFVELLRMLPILAWGLDGHFALPGYGADDLNRLLCLELVLMSAGLASYYLGFWMDLRLPIPSLSLSVPRNLVSKLLLAQLISFSLFCLLMFGRGGLTAHVDSWSFGRSGEFSGSLIFVLLPLVQFSVSALLLYFSVRPSAYCSPVFLGFAILSAAMMFLVTGSRSAILYPLLIALIIAMLRRRRLSWFKPLVVGIVVFLALAVLGNFRRSNWGSDGPDWEALTSLAFLDEDAGALTEEFVNRSGEMRGTLPILARVPSEVGYLRGSSYMAILALPVPRALWPNKPKQIGGHVGLTFYGYSAGVPPGAVGEAYWNSGFVGVVVVFFLFGCFHRWLMRLFLRYQSNPGVTAFYAVSLFLLATPASNAFVNFLYSAVTLLASVALFGMVNHRNTGKRA